ERWIDSRYSSAVVVRRPYLAGAINGHPGRTPADADGPNIGAVALQMTDGVCAKRMCNPEVVVAINDAALCPGRALSVGAEECAVGSKLAHRTIAIGGVINVALAVNAEAVTGVAIAAPVRAVRPVERLRCVPPEHGVGRPDDAVTIDEAAVTTVAYRWLGAFNDTSCAVDEIEPLAARAAYPQ